MAAVGLRAVADHDSHVLAPAPARSTTHLGFPARIYLLFVDGSAATVVAVLRSVGSTGRGLVRLLAGIRPQSFVDCVFGCGVVARLVLVWR